MPDFQHLSEYIESWGLPTREARLEKRLASTLDELKEFYETMGPHLNDIIDFLNQWPLNEIPAEHRMLADTALMMCEVDNPVNKWRSPTLDDGVDPTRLEVKGNLYDSPQLDATKQS
tara:strand:+ start:783 stop:1133 length:351 start_codon:yes stop_codon:yes gene_type:complete